MKPSTVVQTLCAAVAVAALWLAGNVAYFHTLNPWNVPAIHQAHWLVMLGCSTLIISRAMTMKGSLEDRMQQIIGTAAILYGAYALTILLGRQFFSRSIMITAIPATTLCALIIVWYRSLKEGTKVGIIAPLVKSVPPAITGAVKITDPGHDFRDYDVVLVNLHEPVSGEWARALSKAMLSGCRVRHIEDHLEEMSGAVSLDHFELEHMASTEMNSFILLKRLMDIVAALVLLPLALPIIALGALAVVLDSGGPAFFIQERIGMGGAPFRMWKLRTMQPHDSQGVEAAAVPGDARVTRVGRILRRTRIDELPQLWNVLKGDMSLIGPRPEAVAFHNAYTEEYPKFAYRCLVRPGISGWAQVNAPPSANAGEAAQKLRYDLYYVKRQSLALDVQIALRTIWTVMQGSGVR